MFTGTIGTSPTVHGLQNISARHLEAVGTKRKLSFEQDETSLAPNRTSLEPVDPV